MAHYQGIIKRNFMKYVEPMRKNCELIIPNFSYHHQSLDLDVKKKEIVAVDLLVQRLRMQLEEKTLSR